MEEKPLFGPDFSLLPDVVWVNILTRLCLSDRNSVAQTCHSLNAAFNHPTLWHTVEIYMVESVKTIAEEVEQKGVTSAQRYLSFVKRFGRFFQDLTLTYQGHLKEVPKPHKKVILTLGERCRLQNLTLRVKHTSIKTLFRPRAGEPFMTDLNSIGNIVTNAFRMKSFSLELWPMYRHFKSFDILAALRSNEKIKNIEHLSLFWLNARNFTWASLNVELPTAEDMIQTVLHFTCLTHLKIRSSMLSNEVILAMSGSQRATLQNLSILLTYSRHTPNGLIPTIHASTWKKMVNNNVNVSVDVTVVTRIPPMELAGFLKPEIPLSGISFMHYSRCDTQDVISIQEKYSKTLQKFVDYTDATYGNECLVDFVETCDHLTYFVYHGEILHSNVLTIARLKGRRWYWLEFFEDNIKTSTQESIFDDDTVVAQNQSGEYYLVSSELVEESESDRLAALCGLQEGVKQALGRAWYPVIKSERPGAEIDQGNGGHNNRCVIS